MNTPITTPETHPEPLPQAPGSAITVALKAAATLALTCKKLQLATEFTTRAREHIKERELLDWAETLLCNAECPKHCKPEEWRDILKRWRDEKHGVTPNTQAESRRDQDQ
jgi:hypothetical protein